MAQSATQETTGATRVKGPFIVTLRGAGGKGHDFTFGGVGPKGAGLDEGISIQVPTAQTANCIEIEKPDGTTIYAVDASGNIISSSFLNVSQRVIQVLVTSANILAMFTTPVSIIPAPAAGQCIIVNEILVELDLTATQYAAGGVVHFYYHGQTTEIMAQTIAAATVNGGAGRTLLLLEPVQTAGGSVVTTDVGIDITNATQLFTTGTGTMKVTVWYSVLTEG